MKKKILSLVTLVAMIAGLNASAQEATVDNAKCPENRCAALFEGIELTPDQQKQVDELCAEMQCKRQETKCDEAAKCDKEKKCDKAAKCDKGDKKCDKAAKCDKGDKKCDKGDKAMKPSADCKDTKANFRAERRAQFAKNNRSIGDRQAKMEARKQCKEEFIGKMKEILTPDQYVKFLENMATMGGRR